MSWKIRHEGSPQHIELATAQEVLQGLVDGVWEPTDEVRGPGDAQWQALENHPQFAEAAADIEPLPKMHEEEAKLDMTALIDVCLVLLIFFILTTSYTQLQAYLDQPTISADTPDKIPVVTNKQIEDQMIRVTITLDHDKPIYRVEDKVVDEKDLPEVFNRFRRNSTKTRILLIFDGDATNDMLTKVDAAAAAANIDHVSWGIK
jgi:biopolymer transport protein ExbD